LSLRESLSRRWPVAVFVVLFLLHAFLVTRNWSAGFLVGHEFRQSQTALSTYFIRANHDYSLAYPTPVLGKPWSIPMEFPLYQWSVARLADATGWDLWVAARAVSLFCFYLTLPAIWLLLDIAQFSRRSRWIALSLVVSAPLYIFYSRAFLIESMALAAGVWFLVALLRVLTGRGGWPWYLLAISCGVLVALVKITTAMVWLSVGALVALGFMVRAFLQEPREGRWRKMGVLALQAAVVACPAVLAGAWWVSFADAAKAASPTGAFLGSASMSGFNFGHIADRSTSNNLSGLLVNWSRAITPLWAWLPVAVLGIALGKRLVWLGVFSLLLFVAVLATFPVLYRNHDYYYYAAALLPLLSTAAFLTALEERPRVRWLAPIALAVVVAGQFTAYFQNYYRLQNVPSNGGSGLTNVLRDVTPRDSVLVIAGEDWSAVTPYYTERRALMLREEWLFSSDIVARAFENLRDEQVSALLLVGKAREDAALLATAVKQFDLQPEVALRHLDTDVYLSRRIHDAVLRRMQDGGENYSGLEIIGHPAAPPPPPALEIDNAVHAVNSAQSDYYFGPITPHPVRYRTKFGLGPGQLDGRMVVGAHPDAALWIAIPAGARTATMEFGLPPETYAQTDGVEFLIVWHPRQGPSRELLKRHVDPAKNQTDRGTLTVTVQLPDAASGELEFATTPCENYSYDWAYWKKIEVR